MHGGDGKAQERGVERRSLDGDDDDINFPVASVSTLRRLLSQPPPLPPSLRGDEAAARRQEVAAAVHASWTHRGTEVAGLAEHFLDGSIDALDELVIGGSEEEEATRTAADGGGEGKEKNGPSSCRSRLCGGPPLAAVDASDLSYDAFVAEFMEPGVPVVVRGAASGWRASREWASRTRGRGRGGLPLPLALAAAASPGAVAPVVYRCGGGEEGPRRGEMPVREFAERWAALEGDASGEEYLKDWHFCLGSALSEGHCAWYSVPPWFGDDWLNGALLAGVRLRGGGGGGEEGGGGGGERENGGGGGENEQEEEQEGQKKVHDESDFRFVYAGSSHTATPLHADVLSSCSWSANVAGRKRWRLLPPGETHLLFDRFGRELAPDFFVDSSSSSFPLLHLAAGHVSEVVQEPGDAIFVPPGWHHTVVNLGKGFSAAGEEDEEEKGDGDGDDGDDSGDDDEKTEEKLQQQPCCGGAISINHNWFNAHSLHWVWSLLRSERRAAVEAIEDCRSTTTPLEFEGLVQRNLGASAGMDFSGLARVLEWGCRRAERRLRKLMEGGARRGKGGGEDDDEEEKLASLTPARVLACRLDASRAAAVVRGLEEALSGAEPPAFVLAAIRDARRAAERTLEAAARAEEALEGGFAERET